MALELSPLWTLVAALVTIELGKRLNRRLVWLERGGIPPAVSAGLVLSLALAGLRAGGWLDLRFAALPRDVLLLVFFASLGLGAHLGQLASAGRGTLVLCAGVVLAILSQNVLGVALARAFHQPAMLGPFMGSIPLLGGHGTAVAWTNTPYGAAVPGAFEVGIGSATLGLVFGGLVAGPVSVWLTTRKAAAAAHETVFGADQPAAPQREPAFSSDRWMPCLLQLALPLGVAPLLKAWADGQGLQVPAFLAALLAGVLITNLADLARRPVDTEVTDLVGTIALRIFLAIAMLGLDWTQLAAHLPMLLTAAAAQVLAITLIGALFVYTLFGRGPEGAAATGGFIGFGLGAMPVALAVMRRLDARFGETPRALLAVTLTASLFTDTANALIITAFFRWLGR